MKKEEDIEVSRLEDIVEFLPNVEWLIEPLIIKNHITLLGAPGGTGKSSIALYFASTLIDQGKKVLYIDAERCGDEIKNRYIRFNSPALKHLLLTHKKKDKDNQILTLAPYGIETLEKIISETRPDLVIIDSLGQYSTGVDLTQRNRATNFLAPIDNLASTYKTGILILCHTNKESAACLNAIDSIAGSKGLTDTARSNLIMSKLPGGRRKITQEKANSSKLSGEDSIPFLFTLSDEGIIDADFDNEYSEVREMFSNEYDSGVKAEKYRKKAIELVKLNKPKTDIIATLKELGAAGTECTRAIRDAIAHISK